MEKENDISADLIAYLKWRGDITFTSSPFNEVDAAIFNQLSYMKFDGLLPLTLKEKVELSKLADSFFSSPDFESRNDNGPLINPLGTELLRACGTCERYKNVGLSFYKSDINYIEEKQFAAFTAFLDDGTAYIAFRGTHDEIVGWKEDFNMAFESPVPAQSDAVDYVEKVCSNTHCKIRIGGHSKGGNLAIYAGVFCNEFAKKKILHIYNNDGPGFDSKIINDRNFQKMLPKISTLMPQSSVVGMLFEHAGKIEIVDSTAIAFMQHDLFSWKVLGNCFVKKEELETDSLVFDKTLKIWLEEMDGAHRKKFVDAVFGVFQASNSATLSEFSENWIKNSPKILKYLQGIDEETKEDASKMIKIFAGEASKEIEKRITKEVSIASKKLRN